ncbi:unnamed protein product [Coffea canephora]|uniref:Phytosulfokine-beta n=1 Tax=Coffea canephora TaxID=49390 RepID=A0A068UZ49_COFCA|nr:unnamed protein product [Coffea canephora]
MKLTSVIFFLILATFLCLLFLTLGKEESNQMVIGGSASSTNTVKAECEKENSVHECKQGKINGSEDSNTILENEDYIYTQSLP